MARHSFGGDISAWAFNAGAGNTVVLASAVPVTFWSARTAGVQYTDLALNADGTGAIGQVTSGDGTTSPVGDIPLFYGPDAVVAMWASANGGPRKLMFASDIVPNMAALNAEQVFTTPQWFGPVGDVNANRIIVSAEATGQVGDLIVAYSGTDTGQSGQRQRTFYLNEKGELRAISAKTNSVAVRVKGQPSQTADVFQQTDISNNPQAWMDASANWRAPNLGHVLALSIGGTLAAGTGKHRLYNDTGATLIIRSVRASVGTAPTGAAITVDVNKNGTTIFTTQANRPSIAAAANTSGKVTNMDVVSLADGDYLTVDVDAIGSGTAGADLVVQVLAY